MKKTTDYFEENDFFGNKEKVSAKDKNVEAFTKLLKAIHPKEKHEEINKTRDQFRDIKIHYSVKDININHTTFKNKDTEKAIVFRTKFGINKDTICDRIIEADKITSNEECFGWYGKDKEKVDKILSELNTSSGTAFNVSYAEQIKIEGGNNFLVRFELDHNDFKEHPLFNFAFEAVHSAKIILDFECIL